MIRYADYSGHQADVVMRGVEVVPFDRRAAIEAAQHAHLLARGAGRPAQPHAQT